MMKLCLSITVVLSVLVAGEIIHDCNVRVVRMHIHVPTWVSVGGKLQVVVQLAICMNCMEASLFIMTETA